MILHRTQGLFNLLLAGQILWVQFVFWASAWILVPGENNGTIPFLDRYAIYASIILIGMLLEASTRKQKTINLINPNLVEKERLARRQTIVVGVLILVFLVATKDKAISRTFLFCYIPLLYVNLVLLHYAVPLPLSRIVFGGVHTERTLLVGSKDRLEIFSEWMREKLILGFQPAGFLSDETPPPDIDGIPYMGKLRDLESLIKQLHISLVLFVEIPVNVHTLAALPRLCERNGARLLIVSDLADRLGHELTYFTDGGFQFVGLREEPLENPWNRALKRTFDIVIAALFVLIVLPPMCLVVWIGHQLQSKGPLFFIQKRAGIQNQTFWMIKFRTMSTGSERNGPETVPGDSRVFPFGAFLRRFSLDELPQFWNVLRGDMSVAGPRPHHIEHNEKFARVLSNYNVRTAIKPGITGLAQIRGFRGLARHEDALSRRVETDIYYIENWSLALDFMIVIKTAWQMLFPPKTAY